MMDLLRWLWGGVVAVARWLRRLAEFVWTCLSSLVTWIIAGVTYVLDAVYDWVASSVSDGVEAIQDGLADMTGKLDTFPDVVPLAAYYLKDVLAMDEAFRLLVLYVTAWVAAKVARLAMVPIRALLELL